MRLHYVERGSGEPLVLLHGNGSMVQALESSGLIDLAARSFHRVPGTGHIIHQTATEAVMAAIEKATPGGSVTMPEAA